MVRLVLLIAALLAVAAPAAADPHLVRVVMVQRHGIRPPTKDNAALAKYAAEPWPSWSVAPGELTPHGRETVVLIGKTVARTYRAAGLIPSGCAGPGQVTVWADNADERTRETGRAFMSALQPGCGVEARWSSSHARDPIFGGTDQTACAVDPAKFMAAMQTIKDDPLVAASLDRPLADLQRILAPDACSGGAGTCFSREPAAPAARTWFPVTASLAEDLLLEYVDDKPMSEVGWGRASKADIERVMPLHERAFALLRDNLYLASRRGAPMARTMLRALAGEPVGGGPQSGPRTKVLVLSGHDTNLAWMSGLFGVYWSFPDNPQFTAPSTTLAFELWRDGGKDYVRPVIYYLSLDQLRTLQPPQAEAMPLAFKDCESGPMQTCPLDTLKARVDALIPDDCGKL